MAEGRLATAGTCDPWELVAESWELNYGHRQLPEPQLQPRPKIQSGGLLRAYTKRA